MSVYSVGTCSLTNGSATISGSGTAWSTGSAVEAGDIFVRTGDSVCYNIASVTNDTTLVLTANYGGATGSGQYYGIYRDFSVNSKLPSLFGGDKGDWAVALQDTINKIDNWALGWNETPFTCTYASATTFTCSGDKTTLFVQGIRLKIVHAGGTTYHNVTTSSYGAPNTTVTVDGTSITSPISKIYHSLIAPGASGADPLLISTLTASLPVFTNASKILISNTMTGTGSVVMSTSPVLVTPALGTPSAGVLSSCSGYPGLAITAGKTVTATQDTSLDEAVAMSSKAPKASPTFTTKITTPIIDLKIGRAHV